MKKHETTVREAKEEESCKAIDTKNLCNTKVLPTF